MAPPVSRICSFRGGGRRHADGRFCHTEWLLLGRLFHCRDYRRLHSRILHQPPTERRANPGDARPRAHCRVHRFNAAGDSWVTAQGDLLWPRYRADAGETAQTVKQALAAMPVIRRTFPRLSINLWTPLAAAAHVFNLARQFPEAEAYAREELAGGGSTAFAGRGSSRAQTLGKPDWRCKDIENCGKGRIFWNDRRAFMSGRDPRG